jgi:hypothetical protein
VGGEGEKISYMNTGRPQNQLCGMVYIIQNLLKTMVLEKKNFEKT